MYKGLDIVVSSKDSIKLQIQFMEPAEFLAIQTRTTSDEAKEQTASEQPHSSS